jgi:hypothetical protein
MDRASLLLSCPTGTTINTNDHQRPPTERATCTQPLLNICARRNYPLPAEVCLRYGVPVCTMSSSPHILLRAVFVTSFAYLLTFFLSFLDISTSPCANKTKTYHAQTQGASNALLIAADQDRPAIVKVILQYWTGEDEMVNLLVFMSCAYVCMCEGVQF